MLAAMTGAEAGVRRVVHVYADTIVVHPRAVSPPAEDIFVRGTVRVSKAKRPTKAALIACQMGPNFLGEAWRGKRYRPFTRTGRPRVCLTG